MRLLMFAASLNENSLNKKLIKVAEKLAQKQGVSTELVDFAKFSGPLYNADIQNKVGFPAEITFFVDQLKQADGLVIASPEYNYSIPGTLKNLIDWVSRLSPLPWKNYPILLMSASPSLVGGNRGLWATRVPLETCLAYVFPDMFSLASAHTSFDEAGQLKDKTLAERLEKNIASFIPYVAALRGIKS